MSAKDFSEVIDLIRKENPRFEKGAYYFVRQALDHTLTKIKGQEKPRPNSHVSGQELLTGIKDFALAQYGPMAKTLFDQWNIHQCSDFGDIVFTLVEYGVLGKTESDRPEDFSDGYTFEAAFVQPFKPAEPGRYKLSKPKDDEF